MKNKYSLYSIYLNIISIIIGSICLIISIIEKRYIIIYIILVVMTIIELIINLINYRKLIDKKNKL